MKLVSFLSEKGRIQTGLLRNDLVLDLETVGLPSDMISLIELGEEAITQIRSLPDFSISDEGVHQLESVVLKAPIPRPTSIRDFYAFEEHVKTARGKRGLDVIPEWYEMPVFYFTNHMAVKGAGEAIVKPPACKCLDFELEIACVIGRQGSDIKKEDADHYIFGYFIMNDWSARDLQREEMKVGLGPAKGKDFATSLGPYLVTKEELETFLEGGRYNLTMTAKVNGTVLSKGNFNSIYYTFAEMIERASAGVTLYPGEVIGSGTVGTGCILELGTEVHRWLERGDVVELEIDGLGVLQNRVE
jgi:2-keto-4-pentenoate hydratase/2-oxohepta-3-ene-1,7-dioic acid hydratase in catechol pathway